MYLRFNHVFFTTGNMKSKEYDNVVTSPNSYRKIVETETKVIPLHVTQILNLISVCIRQLKYCLMGFLALHGYIDTK